MLKNFPVKRTDSKAIERQGSDIDSSLGDMDCHPFRIRFYVGILSARSKSIC